MTSKDLIYRQQAIEAIVNAVSHVGLHDNSEVARYGATFRQQEILGIIDALPSAQPERKRGRCVWCSSPFRIEYYWIDREGNTASFQDEECHVVAAGIANFCPNCGADMRGEQE